MDLHTLCRTRLRPPRHTRQAFRGGLDAVRQTQARAEETVAGRVLPTARAVAAGTEEASWTAGMHHGTTWWGCGRTVVPAAWRCGWLYWAESRRPRKCHPQRWRDLGEERLTVLFCWLSAGCQWADVRKMGQYFNLKGRGEGVKEK